MNTVSSKFDKGQEEKALLDELRAVRPDAFNAEPRRSASILEAVGVHQSSFVRPNGRIKSLPFDFIVEEIRKGGSVVTIDETSVLSPNTSEEGAVVFADLVKIGLSTLEAVDVLAVALGCEKSQIGYAGIKDTVAITAQKISIRGVSIETVKALQVPQLFLKNISLGKGVVQIGDLEGNRFTILVRTTESTKSVNLADRIADIEKNGLINYYGPQRFGTPRYISHIYGKYILQGNFKKMVEAALWYESKFEWQFITQLRQKARACGENWKEMHSIFSQLPYRFHQELRLLDRLMEWNGKGDKWTFALGFSSEQVDFWPKSYASYLANQFLSEAQQKGAPLPERIPLLLNMSATEEVDKLYGRYLERDCIANFREVIAKIPYIRKGDNSFLQTKIYPKVHAIKAVPQGFSISFDLPKGAYATTLLYELFDIDESYDDKEDLTTTYVDTKKVLDIGSFDSIYDWAKQYTAVDASENK